MPVADTALSSGMTITSDGTYTVDGTLTVTSTITISGGSNVIIKGTNSGKVIRDSAFKAAMFNITGGNVTFTDVTLDGSGEDVTGSLIHIEGAGASVTLGNGAVLQNNKMTGAAYGGAIMAKTGSLTMETGAVIKDCAAGAYGGGGGVALSASTVDTTFTMNGGTITGCDGNMGGGGVLNQGGTFTMMDGEISGNKTPYRGGGVYGLNTNAIIALRGGTITKNTAGAGVGGGVCMTMGTIKMSGSPVVTGNTKTDGTADNVYLFAGQTIQQDGALGTGKGQVGVYVADAPAVAGATREIVADATEGEDAYFFSDNATGAGITFEGSSVYLSYDAREGGVKDAALNSTGNPYITVFNTMDGYKYALVDADGKIVSEGQEGWEEGHNAGAYTFVVTEPFTSPLKVMSKKVGGDETTDGAKDVTDAVHFLYVAGAANGAEWAVGNDSADGSRATPLATIKTAYDKITASQTGVIVVLNEVTVTTAIPLAVANTVTITGETAASGAKLARQLTTGYMVTVSDGSVTFRNITLDGGGSGHAIVGAESGALLTKAGTTTLGKGTVVTNHVVNANNNGEQIIFSSNSGTIIVDGAQITGNTVNDSSTANDNPGGILTTGNSGTTIFRDGGIYGNTTTGNAVILNFGRSNFTMTGGYIRDNTLGTNATAAVAIRSATIAASLHFGGTPYIYNNKTVSGEQRNLYMNNSAATSWTIDLTSALKEGAYIGVQLTKMPTVGEPVINIIGGGGTYTAQASDANYFTSDKATAGGVRFDDATEKVVLDYELRQKLVPGLTDDGKPTVSFEGFEDGIYYALTDGTTTTEWVKGSDIENNTLAFTGAPTGTTLTLQKSTTADGTGPVNVGTASFYYVAGAAGDGWVAGNNSANGSRATPFATIKTAYDKITAGSSGVIVVLNALSQPNITLGTASDVTITGETAETIPTVTRNTITGAVFTLSAGTLSLGNVTISGGGDTYKNTSETPSPLFEISGANTVLNINDGATLCDNWWVPTSPDSNSGGAGVRAIAGQGATVNMTGGKISGNKAPYGAGVMLHATATLNMTGGEISGNQTTRDLATWGGAGVYLWLNATFNMEGGKIINNTSLGTAMGGGVVVYTAVSVFHMNGGEISGNKSGNSSGIAVLDSGATMTFSGSPVVRDNVDTTGNANNLYLGAGSTAKVSGKLEGAQIGVTLETWPSATDKVKDVATGEGYKIVDDDAAAFVPDIRTNAGVRLDGKSGTDAAKVVLDYDLRTKVTPEIDSKTGKGVIEVGPTEAGASYAVLDKNGKLVSGPKAYEKAEDGTLTELTATDNGWVASGATGGTIVFKPVLPGQEYTVVKTKNATENKPEDVRAAGTEITVPVVGSNVSTSAPGTDGKVSIYVNPSDPGVKYNVADSSGNIVGGDWQQGHADGSTLDLDFPGMTAGESYQIVAVPADTKDEDLPKTATGDSVTMPDNGLKAVAGDSITRDDGTNGKDKIVLKPVNAEQDYGVYDPETGKTIWLSGKDEPTGDAVDGALTFDDLDPDKDYQVVTRTPATADKAASLPTKGVEVPAVKTVKPDDVGFGATDDGKSTITVGNTDENTKYAVVDKDGNVVIPPNGDKDGWLTGNGGELTFAPLTVGDEYTVVAVPKKAGDTDAEGNGGNDKGSLYPASVKNPVGPNVTIPAVTEDQLSGSIQDKDGTKTATITIDPADKDMVYGLVDADGNAVTPQGDWKEVGADGTVSFPGLAPETGYKVVAKPKGDFPTDDGITTASKADSGAAITTPTDKTVAADKLDREHNATGENADKDKITITGDGTNADYDYAVVDKTTGEVVAPVDTNGDGEKNDADGWQQGTGAGDLTFDGLDPNKEYEVIMRPHTEAGTPVGIPATPGVTVGKVGAVNVTGVVKDKDGNAVEGAKVSVVVATTDGGTKTLTATTNKNGEYELKADSGVKLPGGYTLVVKSDKGDIAKEINLAKTSSKQDKGDVNVNPEVTNLVTGVVTDPVTGGPLKDAAIVVIDKKTGEAVTLPDGTSVVKTDDAGAYVVDTSKLPVGDYVVKASGKVGSTGVTGLTEVHVDDKGDTTPIKPYKNTNVAPAPGGILSGVVTGEDGKGVKGAEVTVAVPIQSVDATGKVTVIGAKNVTVTTGEDGRYFIPGVPAGDYPVSVTTPDKSVAQAVISANGSDMNDANIALPKDDAKPTHDNVVSGIVMDEDGKPVKDAAVTIYDKDGNKVTPTVPDAITTGAGGGWAVMGLDPDKGPFHASVDADGTNGVTSPFEVKDNGANVKAGTVELSGTVADGGTFTGNTDGKLLTGVVKDENEKPENEKPVSGATVVVKDKSGNVIATTTTDENGLYVVPNVPEGATVTITAPNGGSNSIDELTEEDGAYKGDAAVAAPGSDTLVVIGPDGGKLPVKDSGSGTDAIVSIKDKDGIDASGSFTVDDGVVKVNTTDPKTPAGTYTVTVEQDGMKVEKKITVGGDGTIQSGAPIVVDTATVSGKLDYGSGAIPSDATVSIQGENGTVWGESKVNPNTGKYEITGIPDGEYQVTVTVKDAENSGKDVAVTGTVTMKDGKPSYDFSAAADKGATVEATEDGGLRVQPTTAVDSVITAIDSAIAGTDNLTDVTNAMDDFKALSAEEKKQVSTDKVNELSKKLETLLGDKLSIGTSSAEGVKNTTEATEQLDAQRGLLVQDEVDAANTKKVDVNLSLVAENVTENAPAKDVKKTEVAAKGAEVGAYYDVSIIKQVKVTEGEKPAIETTSKVESVPLPITITLLIPAEIQGHTYYNVIRVHGDDAVRIPSDATETQITFSSNLYSTYAIVWSDTPIFADDVPVAPDHSGSSSGSGGGSGITSTVKVDKTTGGSVTVTPDSPKAGDKVTITVKPDAGNMVDEVVVTDSKGNKLTITNNGDGTYSYTQPENAPVTVKVTFTPVNSDPHANGVADLLKVDDHIAYMQGNDKGAFMPEANMTRAEAAQMLYNLLKVKDSDLNGKSLFSDVDANAWYAKAVNTLASRGILKGVGDDSFAPERTITRAEFVTILTRFAVKASGKQTFSDVETDYWAADAINSAAQYGWVTGYGDGTFKPLNHIARSEAAAAVNRMLNRSADASYVEANMDSLKTFPDVEVSNWAFGDIMEAANAHDFDVKDGVEAWVKVK